MYLVSAVAIKMQHTCVINGENMFFDNVILYNTVHYNSSLLCLQYGIIIYCIYPWYNSLCEQTTGGPRIYSASFCCCIFSLAFNWTIVPQGSDYHRPVEHNERWLSLKPVKMLNTKKIYMQALLYHLAANEHRQVACCSIVCQLHNFVHFLSL